MHSLRIVSSRGMLEGMEEKLREYIRRALDALGVEPIDFSLEYPKDMAHGDFACSVAMVAAKGAGMNPRELAEKIVAKLGAVDDIEKIEVAGAGFINFTFAREYFSKTVEHTIALGDAWGRNEQLRGKRVMVEYTQPNPFKPFHIGHLMSNTLGESLARLVGNAGATLCRANYQGDVGLHVAKAIWGLRAKGLDVKSISDLGEAYVYGNAQYEENEQARAEIVALNKQVYANSPEILDVYQTGRAVSLAHFEELYAVLGTKFDEYFFESQSWEKGKALVEEGIQRGIFKESDGAIVFPGEEYGLHTRVFITREGVPTYEAKDLGLVLLKSEAFPFDLSITTTAVEQEQYFNVVFKAIALLRPEYAGKLLHVHHGMMQLSDGKMSSRKGNVITGESLIEAMRERALEKMSARDLTEAEKKEVAEVVAVAAIKYMVLRQGTGKNIVFDPEASLSFEGDSGPYLQYAHTRAVSVLKKAEAEGLRNERGVFDREHADVTVLERLLVRFPAIVMRAQAEYEPHYITTYLTELAGVFNRWYAEEKIVDKEDSTSPYKVALTDAFRTTMKNGLLLLGIRAPERM